MIVTPPPNERAPSGPPPFVRAALGTYSTNVLGAFLSLVNVLVIARVLGAEGRGNVAFLTAIALLVANLATFGIQEANGNFAASEPRSRPALATNSIVLALALGTCAIAVLSVLTAVAPGIAGESDPALRWLTLAFVPVLILQYFFRFLVLADYGFVVSNVAYLLAPLLNLGGNVLLAAFGVLSVGGAVGIWLAGQALEVVILAAYIHLRLAGFGRPDLGLAQRSLGFGAKAHAGRVMLLGNYRLDQWFLGAIAGPRELGLYSIAVAWAEALWYLPTALAAVQRPGLVRAGLREAGRRAARVFRVAMIITVVSGAVMFAAAPILCATIFGEDFDGSIPQLRVLVFGVAGVVALKLFGMALVAQGRPVLQSVGMGAGFVLTIGLDVALIPRFGGLGAAVASTLAYTAAGIVTAVLFMRTAHGRASDLVPRADDGAWLAARVRVLVARRANDVAVEQGTGEKR